ncbi:MAG: helix-turn-helix transcriptional regulator [Verrucomicrobiae bacterium]|nr:helix-turn-helix transcriptional regulator [Verrucomicrobiae bacterium]
MEPLPTDFSALLKQMRASFQDGASRTRGLTLRELGWRSGIHYTRIAAFESGRRKPGLASLKKLAQAFNLEGEEAQDFITKGREDARLSKTNQDFPLVPNAVQRRLLQEISMALRNCNTAVIENIFDHPDCDLMWVMDSGEWFAIEIATVTGRSPTHALGNLSTKLKKKAESLEKAKSRPSPPE